VTARCAAASAFLDGGFWSLTPDGEVNLPRNRAGSVVKAWASRQYAKWVEPGSPGAGAALGDELEIVPVTDLARAHEGDKVTLRVLWRGKPVDDAIVAIDHRPLAETDGAGEARVRLRTSGVETVSATLRRAIATPEAESEVLEASLSFQVAR
jgi:nickel transport protein